MNFLLSDDQTMIRSVVHDFALNEIKPSAAIRDEEERFDRTLFTKMGELGLTGIPWFEAYGGLEADYVTYAVVVEQLSSVCASMGITLSAHISLAGWPLFTFGTEEQKQQFLRPMAEGKKLGAFGLTEKHSDSDTASMITTARRDGSHFILNGSKLFVTNAGEADIYIVFAMTAPQIKHKGCSAFIVEKGTPGFSFGKKERKMGIRSSSTMELIFDECRIPELHLLGKEGEGFNIAMRTLEGMHIGISAQAIGIAQGAMDASLTYAKERKQFAKPIAQQQAIAFKLADMATKIEAARLLTYQAAWKKSQGINNTSMESAFTKLYVGDTAMEVTVEAVQIFGGYGYTKDFPVERYMRDAKITQIYEGRNEKQYLSIARMLLSD